MANRKVKPTEDYYDFLPQRLQESTKLDQSEKNVLATLCYCRLNYSIYAEEHDGWFYTSQKDIEEGSRLSHMQANRILLKLEVKKIIERKSGTNHRCTHYRLHPKIVELLPIIEHANDTLVVTEQPKVDNDTLVTKTRQIEANGTLDKIRLDESRKDESRIVEVNVVSHAPFDDGAVQQKKDWDILIEEWKHSIKNAKCLNDLVNSKTNFVKKAQGIPFSFKDKVESARDSYDWRYATLRSGKN